MTRVRANSESLEKRRRNKIINAYNYFSSNLELKQGFEAIDTPNTFTFKRGS